MGNNYNMLAKTFYGLEEVLENELLKLGARDIKKGVRNVSFVGDLGFLYKANLNLRTALSILLPVKKFTVNNEADLYHSVYNFPWEDWIGEDETFAIQSTVNSQVFNNSQFVLFRVKDAIADRLRKLKGKRPDIDTKDPDLKINVHLFKDECTLSLDSSGQPLFKRAYRSATNIAPINEVLAAGILKLAGWNGQSDFLDPMCGSGTFLIEAAMMACNIPPNLNRKEFGFSKWKNYDEELFQLIYQSSLKKISDFNFKIKGFDKAPSAVMKSIDNIKNADLSEFIQVEIKDFFKSEKENRGPLFMAFNPPYGERLELDADAFYEKLGDILKNNYPQSEAWMITAFGENIKHIGLKPSKRIKLFNGKIESRLLKYEIFRGSFNDYKAKK
ncbi:THUMP domain-containing class I SAM-dependent RNA methyltransferase [Psychroflexus maritimus]|uniref:Class I SAM-dependent RNA methyltransferase n=1 Tax=Psychroflexus maritimus TaxID=2714865 RepID=A0A967AHQ3_9FLAO|nr:THUMP domain-containing protein [Psychroflexus maritimus]NGZ90691.1 class I SAM-dependent RNA methyltransferase [Psychroflexus maritimus]